MNGDTRQFHSRAEQIATQWICSPGEHRICDLEKFLNQQPEFQTGERINMRKAIEAALERLGVRFAGKDGDSRRWSHSDLATDLAAELMGTPQDKSQVEPITKKEIEAALNGVGVYSANGGSVGPLKLHQWTTTELAKEMMQFLRLFPRDEKSTSGKQQNAFWVVWNPNGTSPSRRHATLLEAQQEADRLAKSQDGEFIVLSACESYQRSRSISRTNFSHPNGD